MMTTNYLYIMGWSYIILLSISIIYRQHIFIIFIINVFAGDNIHYIIIYLSYLFLLVF